METNNETNDINEHNMNMVKIPTGSRQTSRLFTNVTKKSWTRDYQEQHGNQQLVQC